MRKNHPPAQLIIEFHTNPIVANGSSSFVNRRQLVRRAMVAASRNSAGMVRKD